MGTASIPSRKVSAHVEAIGSFSNRENQDMFGNVSPNRIFFFSKVKVCLGSGMFHSRPLFYISKYFLKIIFIHNILFFKIYRIILSIQTLENK